MVSAKQLSIAGTEPETFSDVDEAAEELRRARADHKRSGDRVTRAQLALIARLEERKQTRYEYVADGNQRYRLELSLPQPTVKQIFIGVDE